MSAAVPRRFEYASEKTLSVLNDAAKQWHSWVTEWLPDGIRAVMVFGPRNKNDDLVGPALTCRGFPVASRLKLASAEQAFLFHCHAVILLDGDVWDETPHDTQLATIDYHLSRLTLNTNGDFTILPDDFQVSGMRSVIERHGRACPEVLGLQRLFGFPPLQMLLPFMGEATADLVPDGDDDNDDDDEGDDGDGNTQPARIKRTSSRKPRAFTVRAAVGGVTGTASCARLA